MTVDDRGSLRLRVGKGARGPLNHARSGWVALSSAVPGSRDGPTASSDAGDSSSSAVPGSRDGPTASSDAGDSSSLATALWTDAGDSSSLATALWTDARVVELREACLRTGFIRGLASGALPKLNFAGYVAQVRG